MSILMIVLLVLGITLVGESLNDLADPRLRIRRRVRGGAHADGILPPAATSEPEDLAGAGEQGRAAADRSNDG